jgi:N-acyl-phosphatidylethanolamine-hydrolysing phospholipase D
MASRLRFLLASRRRFWQRPPHFSTTAKMSSIGGAGIVASLYAVVSNPVQTAAAPEDVGAKAHHLKSGKGFVNPWDSYVETTPWQFMKQIFWYVGALSCC